MKTIATKMYDEFPVSLISNSSETKFNVSIDFLDFNKPGKENSSLWYHFPNMVSENKAREAYKSYE